MGRLFNMILVLTLVIISFSSVSYAAQAKIQGDYCYQYGDSESLMVAKEISYAMALRKAIETYKTFVASTSVVKDFKLRKDLVETIASGYVENIKIIKQDVKGRNVCTELVGYVSAESIESIINKKISISEQGARTEYEGIISNEYIKILYYEKKPSGESRLVQKAKRSDPNVIIENLAPFFVRIVYQAKTRLEPESYILIADCLDKDGKLMGCGARLIPEYTTYEGQVVEKEYNFPEGVVSFDFRLIKR